jgi:GntR family transcriptional regulator of vanillate catabolism
MSKLRASPPAAVRQQVVVDRLREMIMSGEIGSGERLLEVTLSENLNVSRTPIREALIVLAEDGLVEYRPNRGYAVREFTLSYIMDAYVIREALEAVACRLAAERGISNARFNELDGLLKEGDRMLAEGGLREEFRVPLRESNHQFHSAIVEAAHNSVLAQALSVTTNIPHSSSRVVHWYKEGDPDGWFALRAFQLQHHAILRAIKAGEGYRAETIMRGHIANAADGIRQHLARGAEDAALAAAQLLQAVA